MISENDTIARPDSDKRRPSVLPWLSLLLAALALLMALSAVRTANKTAAQRDELEQKVEQVMSLPDGQASPGGGVGDNTPVPVESGNTLPNGNGQ